MLPLPPGPKGQWPLGCLRELRDDPLELFRHGMQEYGDVVRYPMLRRTLIMVSNPEGVSHVLKERARSYTKMTHGVRKLRKLMDGVTLMDGAQWVARRKLINPAFRSEALAGFFALMRMESLASFERLDAQVQDGGPLDFSREASRVTLGIACRAFFGSDEAPGEQVFEAVHVLLDEARVRPYRVFNPPLAVPTRANRAYNRAVASIGAWAQAAVAEREREHGRPNGDDSARPADLLSFLIAGTGGSQGLTMDELVQELQTFLVAAHDTTANAILWALYYLDRDRGLYEAVAEEARGLADGPQSFEDLRRLPQLECVLNESLRLRSPAWILPRSPLEDDEIGGYHIPRGCSVYISPYLTHRHPDHWPDPERFDPGRFEKAAAVGRHPTAFIPFGAGPRQCVGREFARMEALTFLSMFLARYEFEVIERDAIQPVPLVTLKPHDFRIGLRARGAGAPSGATRSPIAGRRSVPDTASTRACARSPGSPPQG